MSKPTWIDDDPDPTGVRILLAAQPDPGPMPASVSDRIVGALAEVQRRAQLDPDAGSAELSAELGLVGPAEDLGLDVESGARLGIASGSGVAAELPPDAGLDRRWGAARGASSTRRQVERRGRLESGGDRDRTGENRRRWVVLGSAAATVAALGLVGGLLSQQGLGRSTNTAGSVAGAATRPEPASAPGKAASPVSDGVAANLQGGRLHLEASARSYSRDNLTRLAQDMVDAPGREVGSSTVTAMSGPAVSVTELTECVTTLGEGNADAVFADLATFEGAPGIIIVVVDNGLKELYVVDRGCSKGSPGVLHGPVPMP